MRLWSVILSLALMLSFMPLSVPVAHAVNSSKSPYYKVTVYWTVVNDNTNYDNYFTVQFNYPQVYDSDTGTLSGYYLQYEVLHNVADNKGDHQATFTVQGIPTSLFYSNYGKTADPSEWYITKVTVKPTKPVPNCGIGETTLWEGTFGMRMAHVGGSTCQNTMNLKSNPTVFLGWTNGDGTNKKTETTKCFSGVCEDGARAAGVTPITCDSTINVPTFSKDDYEYHTVTKGVVYDQYGGRYPDQQNSIYEKKHENGISFNGSQIIISKSANRSNDYTYTFGFDFAIGMKSEKTVTIKTFDYNVSFYDYDGTLLKTETVDYGKSATPPDIQVRESDGKTKYTQIPWEYASSSFTNITHDTQNVSVYAVYYETPCFSGDGTESSPYLIKTADEWEYLRLRCLNYDTTGEHFRLENDLTVSTPIGTSDHRFKGIFDGNGKTLTFNYTANSENAAPFAFVDGCTVKNLRTVGTINTAYKYAAGLVANLSGTVTIENCRSSVTINSSVNGDGTHGGFVAKTNNSSNLTMRGCLFDGSFSGQSTNSCGGFIGWRNNGADIYDSVFAPSNIGIDLTGCSTFARNKVDTHNSYYLQMMGTDNLDMWKKGYTVTAGADVTINKGNGTLYNVSGITAYGTGLDYGSRFYAGTGDKLSLSHSDKSGFIFKNYSVNTGSVSGNTLTVGNTDTTVNAVYNTLYTVTWKNGDTVLKTSTVEPGEVPSYSGETPVKASDGKYSYTFKKWSPALSAATGNVIYTAVFTKTPLAAHFSQNNDVYTIHDETGWEIFCECLDDAAYNDFSGKTVRLGNSITVSRSAGNSSRRFKGTFDGNGKTLTFNRTADAQFCAPFSCVNGTAAFRDLTVGGTINTAYENASGLIGHLYGAVTVENCKSNIVINSTTNNAGGFVGLCENAVSFKNCVSSAVIKCSGGNSSGFVAWSRSSAYTIDFDGCLFNGKLLQNSESGSLNGGFIGWKGDAKIVTINNCLCAPAAAAEGEEYAYSGSAVFSRQHNTNTAKIKNSYYYYNADPLDADEKPFDAVQGKSARTVTAGDGVTLDIHGAQTEYKLSGITAYADNSGISYGDTFYAGSGDNVALTPGYTGTPAEGYSLSGYTASAGTLDGTTLTMPDDDVVINAAFEINKYTVTLPDEMEIVGTASEEYEHGTAVSFKVKNGYTAKGDVTANGTVLTAENGVYTVTVTDNTEIAANFEFSDGIGASLAGHSVSLDGNIGVNFYMKLSDAIANSSTAYMRFTIPEGGKTETETISVRNAREEDGYHIFKCSVSAKEMNSNITAQIFDGNGGSGTQYTYSVKKYADHLIANADENGTAEQKAFAAAVPLVKAMLHYGAAAQEQFGSTAQSANQNIESNGWENVTVQTIGRPYDRTTELLPEGTTFTGATLSLNSQTTLSLYFKSDETFDFSCNKGMTVETETNGSYLVARIRDIPAKMLSEAFTVSLGNGYQVTYSSLTYCYNVLNDNSQPDSLRHVAQTLYMYSQAANAYFPE